MSTMPNYQFVLASVYNSFQSFSSLLVLDCVVGCSNMAAIAVAGPLSVDDSWFVLSPAFERSMFLKNKNPFHISKFGMWQ